MVLMRYLKNYERLNKVENVRVHSTNGNGRDPEVRLSGWKFDSLFSEKVRSCYFLVSPYLIRIKLPLNLAALPCCLLLLI